MASPALRYGIPDIQLPRLGGGTINPSVLVGHELVLFFCPAEPEQATAEISAYVRRLPDFEAAGAWVMAILPGPASLETAPDLAIGQDPEGAAWAAFESLLEPSERSAEVRGGAFLF